MTPAPPSLSASPAYRLALLWLALVGMAGLLAHWLPLPYAAATPDLQHVAAPPTWHGPAPHYLGTDPLGRDVLAGLVAGARRLVLLSLPAAGLATLLGALAGGAAGFWGNRLRPPLAAVGGLLAGTWWLLALPGQWAFLSVLISGLIIFFLARRGRPQRPWQAWPAIPLPLDSLLLGAVALLGAVPRLLLLLALAAGPPLTHMQLLGLLVLIAWPEPARLVRAQMLRVRAAPFIEAAQASGLPAGRIWWHHALPHACQPLWAFAPLSLAGLVGLESSLAFLGIGQAPDAVSWGSLLATVRQAPDAWWVAAGPGFALLGTLLALQQVAKAGKSLLK